MMYGFAIPPLLAAGIPGQTILDGLEAWYKMLGFMDQGSYNAEAKRWEGPEADASVKATYHALMEAWGYGDTSSWGSVLCTAMRAIRDKGCPWEDICQLVTSAIDHWDKVKAFAAQAPEKAGKVIHLGPQGGE
jgi:hypothetical protein